MNRFTCAYDEFQSTLNFLKNVLTDIVTALNSDLVSCAVKMIINTHLLPIIY